MIVVLFIIYEQQCVRYCVPRVSNSTCNVHVYVFQVALHLRVYCTNHNKVTHLVLVYMKHNSVIYYACLALYRVFLLRTGQLSVVSVVW